ncbi:hypothetical protein RhiirA1_482607 [Rhizophagus irregularis]|uniref:Uncharacterized protein n=1 Tax=Rhizophagus irregularis TaxID=588596 RepID=A0A2N0QLM7_9GLOM|nr:hypothetical protein RhiirA1_482607 [Rhizophagus irregularis]
MHHSSLESSHNDESNGAIQKLFEHRSALMKCYRCEKRSVYSKEEDYFKKYGVRWSELLRLLYMNHIRFAAVDPMHCLFFGVAKWIIKSIFVS